LGAASRRGRLGWEEVGKGGEGKGRGKLRGGKGMATKLLLNQGPSEPCYATGCAVGKYRRTVRTIV